MTKILLISILSLLPYFSLAQEIDQLILNNEYDKALKVIDNELSINEAQPMLYLKRGVILQKRFDYTGAVKALERAYQFDSLNTNILNELGEANSNLGNHQLALPYFKALYKSDTTNSVNALKLARSYFNQRIYREPFDILKLSYARDSGNVFINKQFAFSAARTGNDSLAIAVFKKVISQNPADLSNYTNLASVYQKKENYTEVVSTLEKGLEVFPDEPTLLLKLGEAHFSKREYAKAVIPYEKYLVKGDSTAAVLKNLGISYFFEKREKEGLYLLEKYLLLDSDDPIAGFYIGLCYKELNQLHESISYLNFASKIAIPYYLADIYHHLGNVYGLNREFKKSIEALQKAYELDTTQCSALFEIATTYEELQKDKTPAIKYYNAYLKATKKDNAYYRKLTEYAIDRKRKLNEEKFFEGKKPSKKP